jgi:hypothetical protein
MTDAARELDGKALGTRRVASVDLLAARAWVDNRRSMFAVPHREPQAGVAVLIAPYRNPRSPAANCATLAQIQVVS